MLTQACDTPTDRLEPYLLKRLFYSLMGELRGMPDGAASNLEAIAKHADGILGESAQHLHEKYSPDLHIDLLHYAPNCDRDFHYVVTSGMSDHPMTDNGATVDLPLVELVMALPAHWDVSPKGFTEPATWQPLKLLKVLARYPHGNGTFFAKTHTVPVGEESLLSPMKAVLLMPPVLVPEFRDPLCLRREKEIHFLAVYLIHQDELDLKLSSGLGDLLEKFAEREVTEIYDLQRPSVLS